MGDVSPDLKRDAEARFTIGPLANREFWDEERASLAIDRGTCKSKILLQRIQYMLRLVLREETTRLFGCNRLS